MNVLVSLTSLKEKCLYSSPNPVVCEFMDYDSTVNVSAQNMVVFLRQLVKR